MRRASAVDVRNRVANAIVGMAERVRSGDVYATTVQSIVSLDDHDYRYDDYLRNAIVRVQIPREALTDDQWNGGRYR